MTVQELIAAARAQDGPPDDARTAALQACVLAAERQYKDAAQRRAVTQEMLRHTYTL